MGKIAFVFAGQGAQYPGMGEDLYRGSPAAKRVFDEAEKVRPGIRNLCFSGNAAELSLTSNTQPAVFVHDLACAEALREYGITADFTAGFSLGEIAAAAYGGILPYGEALKLVCMRGEFMREASIKRPGAMAAVLKLPDKTVEELCGEFKDVYPVNYSCPGQLAAAGTCEGIDGLIERVRQAGGRAVKLAVSGAFHCPFMEDASEKLSAALKEFDIGKPKIPIYSNVTAEPYDSDGGAIQLIAKQVASPVLWEKSVLGMVRAGADTFIECGPGKILSGLISRIQGPRRIMSAGTLPELEAAVKALSSDN